MTREEFEKSQAGKSVKELLAEQESNKGRIEIKEDPYAYVEQMPKTGMGSTVFSTQHFEPPKDSDINPVGKYVTDVAENFANHMERYIAKPARDSWEGLTTGVSQKGVPKYLDEIFTPLGEYMIKGGHNLFIEPVDIVSKYGISGKTAGELQDWAGGVVSGAFKAGAEMTVGTALAGFGLATDLAASTERILSGQDQIFAGKNSIGEFTRAIEDEFVKWANPKEGEEGGNLLGWMFAAGKATGTVAAGRSAQRGVKAATAGKKFKPGITLGDELVGGAVEGVVSATREAELKNLNFGQWIGQTFLETLVGTSSDITLRGAGNITKAVVKPSADFIKGRISNSEFSKKMIELGMTPGHLAYYTSELKTKGKAFLKGFAEKPQAVGMRGELFLGVGELFERIRGGVVKAREEGRIPRLSESDSDLIAKILAKNKISDLNVEPEKLFDIPELLSIKPLRGRIREINRLGDLEDPTPKQRIKYENLKEEVYGVLDESYRDIDYDVEKIEIGDEIETRNKILNLQEKLKDKRTETIQLQKKLNRITEISPTKRQAVLKNRAEDLYINEKMQKEAVKGARRKMIEDLNNKNLKLRDGKDLNTIRSEDPPLYHRIKSTEAAIKTLSEDPLLLKKTTFDKFVSDYLDPEFVRQAELKQKQLEVLSQIESKNLQRVDHLRRFVGLPKLAEMTAEQLDSFYNMLKDYKQDDVFLTKRRLEVHSTIDRFKDMRTIRELKEDLAKDFDVSVEELNKMSGSLFDLAKPDYILAKKNPLYSVVVSEYLKEFYKHQKQYLNIKREIDKLAKEARKSRKKLSGVGERAKQKVSPTDDLVFDFLDGDVDVKKKLAKEMTVEELKYANYCRDLLLMFRDKLIEHGVLKNEIRWDDKQQAFVRTSDNTKATMDNYIVHTRRGFLESLTRSNPIEAFSELFNNAKPVPIDFDVFGAGKNIVGLDKFFRFLLPRSGKTTPTKNVAKAIGVYAKQFYNKQALDKVIPLFDGYKTIFEQEKDAMIHKKTVNQKLFNNLDKWINNKKGIRTQYLAFIEQGSRLDTAIKGVTTLVRLMYLGFNPFTQAASGVGENIATLRGLGGKRFAKGQKRILEVKKANEIYNEAKGFLGDKPREERIDASQNAFNWLHDLSMAGFAMASYRSKQLFLLGSLTDAEWKSKKLSDDRLAEIALEFAENLPVSEMSSVYGSTTLGKSMLQFKTWAVPIALTTVDDLKELGKQTKKFIGKEATMKDVLNHKALRRSVTAISIAITGVYLRSLFVEDLQEDDSLLGQFLRKALEESTTLTSAVDPNAWINNIVGRYPAADYVNRLSGNLRAFVDIAFKAEAIEKKWGDAGSALQSLLSTITPSTAKRVNELLFYKPEPIKKLMKINKENFVDGENLVRFNELSTELLDADLISDSDVLGWRETRHKRIAQTEKANYIAVSLADLDNNEYTDALRFLYVNGIITKDIAEKVIKVRDLDYDTLSFKFNEEFLSRDMDKLKDPNIEGLTDNGGLNFEAKMSALEEHDRYKQGIKIRQIKYGPDKKKKIVPFKKREKIVPFSKK